MRVGRGCKLSVCLESCEFLCNGLRTVRAFICVLFAEQMTKYQLNQLGCNWLQVVEPLTHPDWNNCVVCCLS
jgi:hypothetical protein